MPSLRKSKKLNKFTAKSVYALSTPPSTALSVPSSSNPVTFGKQ